MRRFLFALLAAPPFSAFAQPTLNTTCATAVDLPVSGTNVQTEFLYIDSQNFPNAAPAPSTACSGNNSQRIGWFRFTAINTTHYLRTEGANVYGHSLEVFSGNCGALTSIQCVPTGDPYQALAGLLVGDIYYVRVLAPFFCNPSDGNCQLGLAVVSAPTNNECAGAQELIVRSGMLTVNPATEIASIGCTQSQAECAGPAGSADDDCWFHFTATATTHHLPYTFLHGGIPIIQWFSGSCGSLTSLACNSTTATNLTPGQQYYIRLHSNVNDPEQQLRLLVDVCVNAPNDECAGAVPIAVAISGEEPECIRVTQRLSTSSVVPCGTTTNDVWLSFTAPSTDVAVMGDGNVAVALFSGTCGSLTCTGTGNINYPTTPFKMFSGLTVGDTYFLKVGYWIDWEDVGIRVFAAPANDECATATPLPVLQYAEGEGFIQGHTAAATVGISTCNNSVADVWYSFTATADRHLISIECDRADAFIDVEVLSGTCGSLTSVFCGTNNQDYQPTLVPALVPGTDYLLRVYTSSGSAAARFRIGITQALPNDECAGAIELVAQPLSAISTLDHSWMAEATVGTSTCAAGNKDVWYRFTATGPTATLVAVTTYGSFTGHAELFSGSCGALISASCTDLTNTANARFTGLVSGTEYFVRLASNTVRAFVPMLVQAPVNNEITGAILAPFASAFAQPSGIGHGFGATQSLPTGCGGNPDDDTWYRFTATATSHTVKAARSNFLFNEPNQFFGLALEVFDTLTTDMAELAAHSIGCGNNSTVTVSGLVVGNDYWYRVFTYNAAPAEVAMFATWVVGANSDEAAGAIEMDYGQNYSHAFNTTGATQSLPGADCSMDDTADDDIWFTFTATGSPARVVAGYGTADLTLELFSGTPGNLTSIACSDNVLVVPALTTGETYYLRLYSWLNATPVQGRIGLLITPSLTANDCVDEDCLGPVLLSNPSIEQGGYCQTGIMSVADIVGLGVPIAPGWLRVGIGSSDAYNSCALHASVGEMPGSGLTITDRTISRSGKGMAGILLSDYGDAEYREYISAPLNESLVPGEPYLVSFSATAATGNSMFINGIGALLSEGAIAQPGYNAIPAQPQVVAMDIVESGPWTTICGIVVPDAPWDHITIGSFFSHAQEYTYQGLYNSMPYYFIDDVVVARVTDPGCVTGLGDLPPLDESNGQEGDALRVYPNPTNELLNIVADPSLFGQRAVIEVFDATGSRVHAEQVNNFGALQRLDVSREWKEGLYLVMVRAEGQAPKAARVVVKR